MKRILAVIPHLTLSLSLATVTIVIIDMFFNEAMGFVYSDEFKCICLALCVFAYLSSILLIAHNRGREK